MGKTYPHFREKPNWKGLVIHFASHHKDMNKFKRLQEVSKHEGGVDLMSNLPDAILLLILSRLNSTEEEIRSSVLSKRWRYLWTAIPSLDLNIRNRIAYKKSEFKKLVDWVLGNRSADLDCFTLSCWHYYSMSTVERWIHNTVMRNVKQLDLLFRRKHHEHNRGDIELPHCLVTCPSLEVLRFSYNVRLILPSFSGFPALRVLKLESVELFDDDLVKHFLEKSCPLLEDLTFQDCSVDKLDLFCISSPNLKKLSICNSDKDDDDDELCSCLKLSCPKLVSLELTGQVALIFILERLYSLKEAEIYPEGNTVYRLISGISHVESLTIGLHSFYEYIDERDPAALPNLKTLELTTINSNYTFRALIQILKYCPKLESLSLTFEHVNFYAPQEYDYMEFPKLDEAETRWILTPDVQWIEFFEFNGEKPKLDISWYGKENENDWRYVAARWGNN